MKGIILAGGYGTRLLPLTKVTNKHLLPVYNKPMIFYPLKTLVNTGIDDIMIVTGPENAGDFMKLLGSGRELGARLTYRIQDEAGGIAQALSLCEHFVGDDDCLVVLGDNIIEDSLRDALKDFTQSPNKGAKVFLKEVDDPERFGVAVIEDEKLVAIEEKPKIPKSGYAVVGVYLYNSSVFTAIKNLKPSARGELEITDVNNYYISKGRMSYSFINGYWSDAGTFSSLVRAAQLVAQAEAHGR
ncbi:NTP transferase domain-containing protein [Candidatus Micrarchaeota archaeon]|nr:NTP transferase domain-containing protein [Candidatus Micrarchaeota archaeon]